MKLYFKICFTIIIFALMNSVSIKGHSQYQIFENGKVISKPHFRINHKSGSGYITKEKVLSAAIGGHGYRSISLGRNNSKLIHRLVYEAFVGKIIYGYEIHHNDGDKLNNHYTNLSLVTRKQHMHLEQIATKGYVGIVYKNCNGGYTARIGKQYIGHRKTYEDALNLIKSDET